MQVKYFTTTSNDTSNATDDNNEQRDKLISQLGLTGQLQLTSNGSYRQATPVEIAVYRMLLTEQPKLASYDFKPLPLEIMEWLGVHATEFKKIEIWHDKAGRYASLLVGFLTDTYHADALLLASWGDNFDAFQSLVKEAAQRQRDAFKRKLVRIAIQLKQSEAAYNEMSDDQIVTASTPSFYGAD